MPLINIEKKHKWTSIEIKSKIDSLVKELISKRLAKYNITYEKLNNKIVFKSQQFKGDIEYNDKTINFRVDLPFYLFMLENTIKNAVTSYLDDVLSIK